MLAGSLYYVFPLLLFFKSLKKQTFAKLSKNIVAVASQDLCLSFTNLTNLAKGSAFLLKSILV